MAKPLPVIPAGTNVFQPTEMIASRRFQEFLSEIARGYELVVINSSPVLPVGDRLELVPHICPMGLVVTGLQSRSEGVYYGYYSSLNEGASAA